MKIRHIFLGAASALMTAMFISCEDNYMLDQGLYPSLQNKYLSVSPSALEFENVGDYYNNHNQKELTILTMHASWQITDLPEWLNANEMSGGSSDSYYSYVTIAADDNDIPVNRSAVFNVNAFGEGWSLTKSVVASQQAGRASIEIPISSLSVTGDAHTESVDVTTNLSDLKLSSSEEWVTAVYDKASGKINLTFEENLSIYTRSATIRAYWEDPQASDSFTVKQDSPSVAVDDTSTLSVDVDGGTYSRTFTSEASWEARATASWINVTPAEGTAGENTLTISASPNYSGDSRNGYVQIYLSGTYSYKTRIYVFQSSRYISVDYTGVAIAYDGKCSDTKTVSSNIAWEVTRKPEWLHITPQSGSAGETVLSFSADPLTSLEQRSGTVTVSSVPGGSIEKMFSVYQKPFNFDDVNSLEFGWQSSSQVYHLPLPGAWTASVSAGWLTMSEYMGTGETDLTISATRNDSAQPRTATISFATEGKNFTLSVLQQGQYLYIDEAAGELPAEGGSIQLTVHSSVGADTDIEYAGAATGWLTATHNGNGEHTLKATVNPSVNERSAIFVIKPTDTAVSDKYRQGVRYVVKQLGRRLSVSAVEIEMFAKGGTSELYTVTADGDYTLTQDDADTWYTLVPDYKANTFYIVCTENTTHADRIGNIRLSLTGLPYGETAEYTIRVIQKRLGVQLEFKDYDDDQEW